MATIRDIARACGVSVATVSNVLNGKRNVSQETREKVQQKIRELNYTPNSLAKNLKTKQTRTLGVIVEDVTIFSIPAIVDGITACCEDNGYGVSLINLRLFQKYGDSYYYQNLYTQELGEVLRRLLADQVEGIIYVSAHERPLSCLPEDFPVPLAMCYAYSETPGIPSVVVDEGAGATQLMEYVIGLGHRRIGVITGKETSAHMQERLRAYQQALIRHGIRCDPDLVCPGNWERESGYRNTDLLLEKGVTAIFCMNDLMAGGVYQRLLERGIRIPEEVSVFGYDNRIISTYMQPPLTTVDLPLHDMGCKAAQAALLAIREGREAPQHLYAVPGRLIVRDSVRGG